MCPTHAALSTYPPSLAAAVSCGSLDDVYAVCTLLQTC